MTNLISLTRPSLQILDKTQTQVFPDFRISGHALIKVNFRNSRTTDDIDMKLGPVIKLHKRNETPLKNLTMTSCRKIVTPLSFLRFMANWEQSGTLVPDA